MPTDLQFRHVVTAVVRYQDTVSSRCIHSVNRDWPAVPDVKTAVMLFGALFEADLTKAVQRLPDPARLMTQFPKACSIRVHSTLLSVNRVTFSVLFVLATYWLHLCHTS